MEQTMLQSQHFDATVQDYCCPPKRRTGNNPSPVYSQTTVPISPKFCLVYQSFRHSTCRLNQSYFQVKFQFWEYLKANYQETLSHFLKLAFGLKGVFEWNL